MTFETVKRLAEQKISEFGSQAPSDLEAARAVATAAHEIYSSLEPSEWERFKADGIWNDDVAVQAALAMYRLCKEGKL